MAQANGLKFKEVVFQIGDGGVPEVFSSPCGFTNFEFNPTKKDLNNTVLPDCSDPDAPAWVGTQVSSMAWDFSAKGVLDTNAYTILRGAAESSDSRNVRIYGKRLGNGGGTPDLLYEGKGHAELSFSGARGSYFEVDFKITGDGALSSTPVLAP